MEKIKEEAHARSGFEEGLLVGGEKRRRLAKSFLSGAGVAAGVFLMFAVIVIVTTDVRFITYEELAELGLDFFLLLFCSYSMYVTCSDSGMRAGLSSHVYLSALSAFDESKRLIIEGGMQGRMGEFCAHYTQKEQENSRNLLLSTVGISYEEYAWKYRGLDARAVKGMKQLSKAQRRAVIRANALCPIKLTPEMIMKRGRGSLRRSPLGMEPGVKKSINFGVKFISTFITAFGLSAIIVSQTIDGVTWGVMASCCIKLLTVIMNGFYGYKFGYENIAFDTVEYMSDQNDLMRQAADFLQKKDQKEF